MNTLYRIHVEDKGDIVEAVVARHFDAATIIRGIGLWMGALEKTVIIELYAEATSDTHYDVLALANDLKQTLHQQEVLVARFDCKGRMV